MRFPAWLHCLAIVSCTSYLAFGQSLPAPPTPDQNLGMNISQSYHGDQENVNLATGNLYIEIPLVGLPGRNSHDLNISLSYNSQIWRMSPSVQTVVNPQGQQGTETFWNWARGTEQAFPMPAGWFGLGSLPTVIRDVNVQVDQNVDGSGHPVHQFCTTNYRVLMPDGSVHKFPGIKSNCYSDGVFAGWVYSNLLVGDTDFKDPLWMRYDVNNGLFAGNGNRWTGATAEDTNGNLISSSGSNQAPPITYTDTLGRNVQLSYSSGALYPNAVTYKDSSGTTQTITLNYLPDGSLTTTGSFSNPPPVASTNQPNTYAMAAMTCSTSNPCSWGPMLSSIVLPNGLTYTFHYNNAFGELDQITYPSGGYTRYEYATFQRGIRSDMQGPETPMGPWDYREVIAKHVCRASVVPRGALSYTPVGSVPTNTCPVPEDTTIYSPTINIYNVNNASTTVTDPLGNVTVVQFCVGSQSSPCDDFPYETKRQVYDNASHLLRTIDTTYTGAAFFKASETVTLENGLVSRTEWDYQTAQRLFSQPGPPGVASVPLTVTDATGNVTEERELAYGQGAAGSLLRKADAAWGYSTPGAAFNNRKTSEIIYDGSNSPVAQMTFEYDNYTLPLGASGATQHDSGYGVSYRTRGNITAVRQWRNTDGAWLTTRYQYDDAGNRLSATDPLNNTTTFDFTDSFASFQGSTGGSACAPTSGQARAFVTKVTDALNHVTTKSYYSCSSLYASTTDPNNQTTTFTYDSIGRQSILKYPDGGQASFDYHGDALPLVATKTVVGTPDPNILTSTTLDGLGRIVKTSIDSDPGCSDIVDTTYDPLGRVATVSNPHCSASALTDGITSFQYDPLNRLTKTTKQDGSLVVTQYDQTSATSTNANCATTTEEAGKSRKSCTDGLGRLIEVDEPNSSSVATNANAIVTVSGSIQPGIVLATGSAPAVAANSDGRLEAFVQRNDNTPWHIWQLSAGSSGWSGWNSLGGATTSSPVVVSNSDGRLEVFVKGTDGGLWHNWQLSAGSSSWSGWNSLGGGISGVAVGRNSDGRLEAFVLGTDCGIWHNWQTSAGSSTWSGFNPLGGCLVSAPVVASNSDGRLEVFAQGTDNAVYHNWQISVGSSSWSGWNTLGGSVQGVAVASNADGRLEAFARWSDGSVSHNWQLSPGGSWSGWNSLGGATALTPVVASNSDGRLEAFVKGTDNGVWLNWQISAGSSSWNGWNSLGGSVQGIGMARNADGRLEAFARWSDSTLWHIWQLSAGSSSWSAWTALSEPVADSGTVSLSVGGFTATACYGSSTNSACTGQPINNTAAQVASALASSLNSSSSPVTATVSGSTISMIWKTPGPFTPTVSALATTHDNSNLFSNPSFTSPATSFASGGTSLSNGYTTLYSYDTLGNLTCAVQKGSDTTAFTTCGAAPATWRPRSFVYDSLSRLVTATNPESGTISYSYDANGNVLQKTSPAPNQTGSATQTISYCYDAGNRVTGKAFSAQNCPLSSPVVNYFYDQSSYQGLTITNGIGRLTGLVDQAGSGAYSYDPLGRMANEKRIIAGISKNMAYGYDKAGALTTVTYPSGATISYVADGVGRMISAMDNGNNISYATSATYKAISLLGGFVSGYSGSFAGITNSFSYNPRLQPIIMSASAPNQTVFSISYDFHVGNGDNGNVLGITNNRDTSRNQSFTYDALNRLTSAQNTGTDCSQLTMNGATKFFGNNYGYDPLGNLLTKAPTKCSAENLNVSANANNQLHTLSGPDYAYDSAGNMTHDATTGNNYSYDPENRITGVGGNTYTYDADGNRVQKSNSSTGTLYWYMTPGIVAESDLTGTLKSEYVFFDGERIARRDFPSNAVSYYFSDHLKTASVIADSAGNIRAESDYYPWGGELQLVNGDSNHYKFTGKERDSETGLDYLGARYYGNSLGRFLTPDWAAKATAVPYAEFSDPQSLNLYTYVRNIPTTRFDADGHIGEDWELYDLLRRIRKHDGDLFVSHRWIPHCWCGKAPVNPDGSPAPPPIALPPGKNGEPNSWVIKPSGKGKRVKWGPKHPVKTAKGGQPVSSWDEDNDHWDYDSGTGGARRRFLPDGTEVDHNNNPIHPLNLPGIPPAPIPPGLRPDPVPCGVLYAGGPCDGFRGPVYGPIPAPGTNVPVPSIPTIRVPILELFPA